MGTREIALVILWGGAATVAAASPGLREIGHVAITDDVCTNVVVHANSAIAGALRDDGMLAKSIARLRGTNMEERRPGRPAALAEIASYASTIDDDTAHGRTEIKRILDIASDAPATGHPVDARAFAAALGSALDRQASMARDLDEFIRAIDVSALRPSGTDTDLVNEGHTVPGVNLGAHVRATSAITNSPTPRVLANDLEHRQSAVTADEDHAAAVATAAVTGC